MLGIQILKVSDVEKNEINQLIAKRDEYREQKNFEQADRIRDQIMEKNIIFIDHKNSTRWIKQEKLRQTNYFFEALIRHMTSRSRS